MKHDQHRMAAELIEEMRPRGEGDFVKEFAQIFPAMVFLQIMGMPKDKLGEFLSWEHMILHQDSQSDPDFTVRLAGMQDVHTYFSGLIAERRADLNPDAGDIVSAAAAWEIDGQPINDA